MTVKNTFYRWDATREDGTKVTLQYRTDGDVISEWTAPTVPSEPSVPTLPSGINEITINSENLALDGVNRDRLENEIILYTDPEKYRSVNKWGVDVLIDRKTMKVLDVRDRELGSDPTPFALVAGEQLVLSGHYNAGRELADVSFAGSNVVLSVVPRQEPEGPSVISQVHTSVWLMMWPNSANVDITKIQADEIRLAFFIEDGQLVGWGPWGKTEFCKQLKMWLQNGNGAKFASFSLGGGGMNINVSNPTQFKKNIEAKEKEIADAMGIPFRFEGMNWDWENDNFERNAENVRKLTQLFRDQRGSAFYISWSPNGTYKDAYRRVLKGYEYLVDEIAQQFYDSVVSYEQALVEVKKYITQFGASRVGVGMMLGGENVYWDLNEATTYTKRFFALGVRKFNLWEAGRANTGEWTLKMEATS